MPGYEPFLLCDFHVHTRWSDGRLSLRDTIDLYGRTGKFDVVAITDHILMKKDLLARAGRLATLGQRSFGIREDQFSAYLDELVGEAERARLQYDMLVIPGAEITQNKLTGRKNAHIIALDIKKYISADQPADDILREIRRQDALSIACHPHHRAVRRLEISTCYLWDNRKALAGLVDVWEAANRDDLFSVTSLKHFPYVASSDFHKPRHLYSWKTLLRCDKQWPAIRKALCDNVDVALTLFRKESWTSGTASAPVTGAGARGRRVVPLGRPATAGPWPAVGVNPTGPRPRSATNVPPGHQPRARVKRSGGGTMQLSIALGVMATVAQALTAPPPAPPVFNTWFVPRAPLAPPQPSSPAPEPAVLRSTGPMVVCGTVVVPVDAAVDPRMVKSVPTDSAFTMRTITPPLCRD